MTVYIELENGLTIPKNLLNKPALPEEPKEFHFDIAEYMKIYKRHEIHPATNAHNTSKPLHWVFRMLEKYMIELAVIATAASTIYIIRWVINRYS